MLAFANKNFYMEDFMKRTVFAILTIVLCLFILNCKNEPDNDPELAEWVGTWNNISTYFEETDVVAAFNAGASAIATAWGGEFSGLTGTHVKYLFTAVLATPTNKSIKVEGNTVTFYSDINAQGTAVFSGTYTLKEKLIDDGETIYVFEGDQAGAYKYLRLVGLEQEAADAALVFHFQYSDALANFDGALATWWPVEVKQGTTVAAVKKTLEIVMAEYPNATGTELAYYQQAIKTLLGL
jgi:hypothetical protein